MDENPYRSPDAPRPPRPLSGPRWAVLAAGAAYPLMLSAMVAINPGSMELRSNPWKFVLGGLVSGLVVFLFFAWFAVYYQRGSKAQY